MKPEYLRDQPDHEKRMSDEDVKRKPVEHYHMDGIECIDVMRAVSTPEQFQGFCRLTAFKYLFRLGSKGEAVGDAKKALDYVRWLHESLARKEEGK